jgi:hypothetical protein
MNMTVTPLQTLSDTGYGLKEDEIGRACSTKKGEEECTGGKARRKETTTKIEM